MKLQDLANWRCDVVVIVAVRRRAEHCSRQSTDSQLFILYPIDDAWSSPSAVTADE